jgi:mannose-1-phosphate guanylyltransferase
MIRALILAAGLGTRLQPLTKKWPKCLMPIGKRPLLEYWLLTLQSLGIQDVLVNLHSHADFVREFISRKYFADWVSMTHEVNLLGTAGTLRANLNFFRGEKTLLIHGDNWCQCDFKEFINYHANYRPSHCLITMMTFKSENPVNCGIVEIDSDGIVIRFHEKVSNPPGNIANAAVYLLEPEILEWLHQNPSISDFSTEVLPIFLGRISTWHNKEVHRDIGTLPDLISAQSEIRSDGYARLNDDWQDKFEKMSIFQDIKKF